MFRKPIALLALVVLPAGVFTSMAEYEGLFTRNRSFDELSSRVGQGGVGHSYSYFNQTGQMWSCDLELHSFQRHIASRELAHLVAQTCLDAAREILRSSPSMSVAHEAEASALYTLGRLDEAHEALAKARVSGPFEAAYAARRLSLASLIAKEGGPALDDEAAKDARAVIRASGYRDILVRLYSGDEEQSRWVIAALEDVEGNGWLLREIREQSKREVLH